MSKVKKIVFMGTPEIAVESLEAINKENDIRIIITQPDRKGNRKKMMATPVKLKGNELGIPVLSPQNVNDAEVIEKIEEMNPDLIVVVAYGQKIGKRLLEAYGDRMINLHTSLLPKYRGAAPINWVIVKGEEVTGVSIMLIHKKIDHGDVLYKEQVEIGKDENSIELEKKLSKIGAEALLKVINGYETFYKNRQEQKEEEASYYGFIYKKMGEIDWEESAQDIYNKFRGFQPWPGVYFNYHGENVKIHQMNIIEDYTLDKENYESGDIISVDKDRFLVGTGKGILSIEEIQFPGRKRMTVEQYLVGNCIEKENLKEG